MRFLGNTVDNNASTTETAHPFRVEADNVCCAFTEFAEPKQYAYRTLLPYFNQLYIIANGIRNNNLSYEDAKEKYLSCKEYRDAEQKLEDELFWRIDKYIATISVTYGKKKTKFIMDFEVSNEQYAILKHNMMEILLFPLNNAYGVRLALQAVAVSITSK